MPQCLRQDCKTQATQGSTRCAAHAGLCAYKHCRNAKEANDDYCRAHTGNDANRRGGNLVPGAQSVLNAGNGADALKVKGWAATAKQKVDTFLARADVDDWISTFFGGQNVQTCKRVFQTMPTALEAWRTGTKNIFLRPVYDTTSTPNAVNNRAATLTVSPSFLTGTDDENVWVLVHESSHATLGHDQTLPEIVDHLYRGNDENNADFHALSPSQRVANADHYRYCIEASVSKPTRKAAKAIYKVRNQDDPGGGVAQPSRKVTANRGYASIVRGSTLSLFQMVFLELFTLTTQAPEYFHNAAAPGDMPSWIKSRMKTALGAGKSSGTVKNKDFVRLEDVYNRNHQWSQYLRTSNCIDQYDANLHGVGQITVNYGGAQPDTYTMTSFFKVDDVVSDKALICGVKLLVPQVMSRQAYPMVSANDLYKIAKNGQKSRNHAGLNWLLKL